MSATAPRDESVQQALAAEEMRGLELGMRARLIGLAIIAVWVLLENVFLVGLWYLSLIGLLALSGSVSLFVQRRGLSFGWLYVQAVVDAAAVVIGVFVANPFDETGLPPQVQLRFSNELYLYGLVGLSALSYSPRLVLWTGFVGAVAWSLVALWILWLPETSMSLPAELFMALSLAERLDRFADPYVVLVGVTQRSVLMLLLLSATLAIAVARSRRLVFRQVSVERERANLSRYFSPKLVDELAQQAGAVGVTRRRDLVILFADLAGFTTFASEQTPERVIELLREYHRRISHEVFAHDEALEEYLGDGIMATFGNPDTSPQDATNALRCARRIVDEIDEWSAERAAQGEDPLYVRVGVHRGPVVIGNVGDEQLQFAVVGDAVNVASRLQELGKGLEASLTVSQDVIDAVRAEGTSDSAALVGLRDAGEHEVRGRGAAVGV